MSRTALDIQDYMPSQMRKYISNYGWHFNKEACEYAVSLMRKKDASGKSVTIKTLTKDEVEAILKKYNIALENNTLYDATFVYHMGMADYLGSSITDEPHLARYVKDVIDDVDASTETTFRRWVATMVGNGVGIDWSDFI